MSRRLLVSAFAALAACGGGGQTTPDAPPIDAAPPDTHDTFAACAEFDAPGVPVPAHVSGTLSGADLTAPPHCQTIEAGFGVESAGPDSVVHVTGLTAGTPYVVHLTSAADLAFYVATGCDTATGPSSAECLLFEDDSSDHEEVGRFVATGTEAWVIVDFYQSTAPHHGEFTLDVYREECRTADACRGATPACLDGRCVACATSFDCTDVATPVCDTDAHECVAGLSGCTGDDANDLTDDGPAGATVLALAGSGGGSASAAGHMCSSPQGESDFYAFTVGSVGETWDLDLAWFGNRNLDLEVFDTHGRALGLSYWEHPEHVRLTYLPVGRYDVRVSEFSTSSDASPVSYTLSAQRAFGPGCTAATDCDDESRNQIFRGACVAGACVPIAGNGAVGEGGACDSESDCAAGLACPSFFFVTDAATRETCEPGCTQDPDCLGLGPDLVCTTYLTANQCVPKCTSDDQCPTEIDAPATTGPWVRLSCDVATGRCLP